MFSTQVCARATHDYGCHMLTTLDLTGDASGVFKCLIPCDCTLLAAWAAWLKLRRLPFQHADLHLGYFPGLPLPDLVSGPDWT